MKAMLLDGARRPLRSAEVPMPQPTAGQLLLRVRACGVCRTDLHVIDGELPGGGDQIAVIGPLAAALGQRIEFGLGHPASQALCFQVAGGRLGMIGVCFGRLYPSKASRLVGE